LNLVLFVSKTNAEMKLKLYEPPIENEHKAVN